MEPLAKEFKKSPAIAEMRKAMAEQGRAIRKEGKKGRQAIDELNQVKDTIASEMKDSIVEAAIQSAKKEAAIEINAKLQQMKQAGSSKKEMKKVGKTAYKNLESHLSEQKEGLSKDYDIASKEIQTKDPSRKTWAQERREEKEKALKK